jgi:hypothetical protein
LIEMVNNNNVNEKLRKLPVLSLEKSGKVSSLSESRTIPSEQESIEKATEMMEMLKVAVEDPDQCMFGRKCIWRFVEQMVYSKVMDSLSNRNSSMFI